MRIEGKVVLVTGASEGIGAACVRQLREKGAVLSLAARSADKLRAVAAAEDLVVPTDLLDAGARRHLIERTLERFGRVDILVNNAGVGLYVPAHRAQMEQARAMFELNFFAPLDLIQQVVPHMKRQGGGAIVNVGSIAGKVTLPWFTLYSASKYAVGSLTDGLRMELRQAGIHALTVCPGYVKTRFQENVLEGTVPDKVGGLKNPWAIEPEECARALIRGLERDARTIVVPWVGWLLIAAERLMPRFMDSRLEAMYLEQDAGA